MPPKLPSRTGGTTRSRRPAVPTRVGLPDHETAQRRSTGKQRADNHAGTPAKLTRVDRRAYQVERYEQCDHLASPIELAAGASHGGSPTEGWPDPGAAGRQVGKEDCPPAEQANQEAAEGRFGSGANAAGSPGLTIEASS